MGIWLSDLFAGLWGIWLTIQNMVSAWGAAIGLGLVFAMLAGCDLPPVGHEGLHVEDASTSELVRALLDLGVDSLEGSLEGILDDD